MSQRLYVESIGTPIGDLLLVSDAAGRLCAAEWSSEADRLDRALRLQFGAAGAELVPTAGGRGARGLAAYFAGDLAAIDNLPVAETGTPFQRLVWRTLRTIPGGTTRTYGELARAVGRPAAIRAVGAANGANPISVVVPCHRLVGANGSLTGYGGGLERKRWLLAHEGTARPASRSEGTAKQPA